MAKLAERDRFSDEEWALVEQGLCSVVTEIGMVPGRIVWCRQPIDPNDWYRACPGHSERMREEDEASGIFRPRP
jgi:hypothetical protein